MNESLISSYTKSETETSSSNVDFSDFDDGFIVQLTQAIAAPILENMAIRKSTNDEKKFAIPLKSDTDLEMVKLSDSDPKVIIIFLIIISLI